MTKVQSIPPGKELNAAVRAAFIVQGTTLAEWAEAHGLKKQNAYRCLMGLSNGRKAREWRERLIAAAQPQ